MRDNVKPITLEATLTADQAGLRLDQALSQLFPQYSRACLQNWIKSGFVHINGENRRAKDKVAEGEQILINAQLAVMTPDQPQAIPLDIIHQDDDIIVLNKPAGLVVHPAAGHPDGTLVNGLLYQFPELAELPRAGIVHRLDKDTSGIMVVARNLTAHASLVDQLQQRKMRREYLALIQGNPTAGGSIDAPIGRHPKQRKKMAVVNTGKPAITHYRIEQRFTAHTLLRVQLETGRTHQIRVHMAHVHYPIVGDPVYGGRLKLPPQTSAALLEKLQQFKRQALHATALTLIHPNTKESEQFTCSLPEDMQQLLNSLT